MLIQRSLIWLGVEANARAVTTLLAIGGMVGALGYFVFDRIAPKISPQWSSSSFGEGYRRGRREVELEAKLQNAEQSIQSMRVRNEIHQKVRNMSDAEVDAALRKWTRD